jgi:TolB-like protein/Tfp pilus assembly protein PilF
MSASHPQRRLAAILAADMVGYSRLMGLDETGTLVALTAARSEVIDPKIVEHTGRVFKSTGDGLLAEFPSVVSAVTCAVEIQRSMQRRNENVPEERAIRLRIGINLGDIIVEDGDVFGDGVNVAARIESIAPPGGVAVSGTVRDHIGNRLDLHFEDAGEQRLKNLDRPVRIYRIGMGPAPAKATLALPDKPSIAVLPFQNMSGDHKQEYFADGIVEEIITALSRFHSLFVIARNSSFTYKGRAVDVKQVGRELGVRYVLEGSVRKSGSRVRIIGQLINSTTGAHLWADRFEGPYKDIFDLQDQVTSRVVGAIAPQLEKAEIERAKRKPTESLDAYDQLLRGMEGFHKWSRQGNDEALLHFYEAIRLDPYYAVAYAMAARMYIQRNSGGWVKDRAFELAETERLALKAAELGGDDAVVLANAGFALSDVLGLVEDGDAMIERALDLNPNLAWVYLYSSWAKASLGQPEIALERIERALRLSPNDPLTFSFHAAKAWAELFAGRFADAYSSAETAIRQKPGFLLYTCIAAVSAALSDRANDAQRIVTGMLRGDPTLKVAKVSCLIPLRRPEDNARWIEGLKKAGLPE